jgi:glutamine synthetase
VDARLEKGDKLVHAILAEVKALIKSSKAIHFDGNGYSDEWKEEAARRGLDCETNIPRIFDAYLSQPTVEMFSRTGVMSLVELEARNEVKWEMYTKKIQIEARVLGDLALNHIVPVATRYLSILLDNMVKLRELYPGEKGEALTSQDGETVETILNYTSEIKSKVAEMVEARKVANHIESEREKAVAYSETVAPKLEEIRVYIDKLELMVDNQMWPLPKYRELLFIR